MNVLCVISARGGSKGLKDKNIRPLLGKPLIAWSIEQALACPAIKRVAVSTDSVRISDIARKYGAEIPFMRPAELSGDKVGKWDVWKHALMTYEKMREWPVNIYVDLDCTSPLREVADISRAISQFQESKADAVISICEARKNPYFNQLEIEDGKLRICKQPPVPILRRQDAPRVYEHVASIYVVSPQYLRRGTGLLSGRVVGYDIGQEKSLDVDSELDFRMIECLMQSRLNGRKKKAPQNAV